MPTQHTRRWTNAGLTLAQRLQRWANVKQHWFNFPFLKYPLTLIYKLLLRTKNKRGYKLLAHVQEIKLYDIVAT